MGYYLARRHLGLSPQEWDALQWWEQRMYLEGYEDEGLVETRDDYDDSTLVHEEVHQSGGTTITDRDYHATFDNEPGEFLGFGIVETTLG